jgi:peptide chain release factor 1
MILSILMDIKTLKAQYSLNTAKAEKERLEQKLMTAHNGNGGENLSQINIDLNHYTLLSMHIDTINKNIEKYEEAMGMLSEETDEEFKKLIQSELEDTERNIKDAEKEISKLKIEREFHDEDDNRAAILEIRAGAGGDEASLFAADLFKMYKNFSTNNGWNIQIIDSSLTEGGGYKEVVAKIDGKNVYKKLKYESGVHRVQRVPTTESSGRIHTSTASVAILPEAKDIDIDIKPEDLRIDVMRASGAGGQCVNKTDSAVRITHLPTNIVVSCQETKYQNQNKEKAMALLRSRLYDRKKLEEREKRSSMRLSQIGSAMRAEKIRTYNFPQNRVTDHRIKKSWHNLEGIMYGDIDGMVEDIKEGIQLELIKDEE